MVLKFLVKARSQDPEMDWTAGSVQATDLNCDNLEYYLKSDRCHLSIVPLTTVSRMQRFAQAGKVYIGRSEPNGRASLT